ncbi:uncharacterized protein LOC117137574 [Drosophila mauritiana]|uniref:Uncharacterized protein LOC117137574 n=1 Tax=Drosophila mauritiana TaxID=7226 RepID=A0A6P8JXP0_DROMA|nr:uncharacterized protein LOC117137574 [Drosophila mauritiana]
MLSIVLLSFLALAKSAPLNEKNETLCEFFNDVDTYKRNLIEMHVNVLKSTLEQEIITKDDPKTEDYVTFLKYYLDRGDHITSLSSNAEKMEYFRGFLIAAREKSIVLPDLLLNVVTSKDELKANWAEDMKNKWTKQPVNFLNLLRAYKNILKGQTDLNVSAFKDLKQQYMCEKIV